MKLYTAPFAPNPTKVELYLALRAANGPAIKVERIVVNLMKGEHRTEAHLVRNPFGTIPVLELDDGSYLMESLAIIEFFEEKFAEGALLPVKPYERAIAREVERTADVRLGASIVDYVHAIRSPLGKPPNAQLAAVMRERIEEPLDYFAGLLSDGRDYLLGDDASIADCSLASFLNFARVTGIDLIGSRSRLCAWQKRFFSQAPVRNSISF